MRRCCTRCAAPGTCCVRLNKLLRTSTFRLALIYMVLFGGSVLLLLGFIHWATAGFMARSKRMPQSRRKSRVWRNNTGGAAWTAWRG